MDRTVKVILVLVAIMAVFGLAFTAIGMHSEPDVDCTLTEMTYKFQMKI